MITSSKETLLKADFFRKQARNIWGNILYICQVNFGAVPFQFTQHIVYTVHQYCILPVGGAIVSFNHNTAQGFLYFQF